MDWMSTIPVMPTTNPARYIAPTILAVVLYVFFPSLFGLLEDVPSSASFLPTIVCVVRVHNLNDALGAGDGCLSSAATDGFKGIDPRLLLRRVPTANRDRRSSQTLAA